MALNGYRIDSENDIDDIALAEPPFLRQPLIKQKTVKQIFENICGNTAAALTEDTRSWFYANNKTLNYLYAVNARIIDVISKNATYTPAIICIDDVPEKRGGDYVIATLRKTIICAPYEQENNLNDRSPQTFPIIQNIYEFFLRQIAQYAGIVETVAEKIEHFKRNVPGWQPADNTIKDLWLDAYEITNLKLTINNNYLI